MHSRTAVIVAALARFSHLPSHSRTGSARSASPLVEFWRNPLWAACIFFRGRLLKNSPEPGRGADFQRRRRHVLRAFARLGNLCCRHRFESLAGSSQGKFEDAFPRAHSFWLQIHSNSRIRTAETRLSGCCGGARIPGAPANWLSGQLPSSRYHWCDRHLKGPPPATAMKFFKALRW